MSIQCIKVSETVTVFGIASWTGGFVGNATAPSWDNTEAVIIPFPLPCASAPGPKSIQ